MRKGRVELLDETPLSRGSLLDKILVEGDSYELNHERMNITMMAPVMGGLCIDRIDVRFEEEYVVEEIV